MIRNLTQTFAAGEIKTFEISGNYIEILSCQNPIDVFLEDRNGVPVSRMEKASASYYIKIQDQQQNFARVMIKSDTAQTVSIVLADGEAGTRTMAGVIRVVDEYAQNAVKTKSFIATSYDSIDTNTKTFAKVALVNNGTSDILVQKIHTHFRKYNDGTVLRVDGMLSMHIENINAAKFTIDSSAHSTDNLKKLLPELQVTTACIEAADASVALTGTYTPYLPEDFLGGIKLDLESSPIILSPGKMLVMRRSDNSTTLGAGVHKFSALFAGRIVSGSELIPE